MLGVLCVVIAFIVVMTSPAMMHRDHKVVFGFGSTGALLVVLAVYLRLLVQRAKTKLARYKNV